MTKTETITAVRTVCRMRRLSRHTESGYLGWILRYRDHLRAHPNEQREAAVRSFLEALAPRSSASTQNQALNAIVFLYRDVLQQPLQGLGKWARAQRPKRLPTWLSAQQMQRLLAAMPAHSTPRLMAELAYGSGLRLAELLALRIKDIDLDSHLITVRGGKGDKDRITCLPRAITFRLRTHLDHVHALWQRDRARQAAPIQIPHGLDRKYPRAGTEWPWYWVWPAPSESTDPATGIIRRHHLHETTLGKALRTAARKAGLNQRITAHTLRHSFATALLSNGASITQVQELLGHSSVETTQVYLHCIPQFAASIVSPLDAPAPNVIPMPGLTANATSAQPAPATRRHA